MSCGVGRRRVWDLALLWLWCRLAGTDPIQLLAWEPPHASGEALKRQKKKKKKGQVLTCATTWMNLENIMLSERSQTQKDKYWVSPFIWKGKNRKIYSDRKYLSSGLGLWRGSGERWFRGAGFLLGVRKMFSTCDGYTTH